MALPMMALTAAKATVPATISFGLCSSMRRKIPRSADASIASEPRARRGLACLGDTALGTFLHLTGLIGRRETNRGGERCNIARGFGRRREFQRQCDNDGG